ncbi:MAG: hypothetical protein ACI86H_000980 [bacterium]|jgi:hypothetical protein
MKTSKIVTIFLLATLLPFSAIGGETYERFYSKHQNYFLIQPKIVEQIFFRVVKVKGNYRRKRWNTYKIKKLTLSDSVDRYHYKSRKLEIPKSFVVNIPEIRFSQQSKKKVTHWIKGRRRRFISVRLDWSLDKIAHDYISSEEFLKMIHVATDSYLYKKIRSQKWVFFRASLPKSTSIYMEPAIFKTLFDIEKKYGNFSAKITIVPRKKRIEVKHDALENIMVEYQFKIKSIKVNNSVYYPFISQNS